MKKKYEEKYLIPGVVLAMLAIIRLVRELMQQDWSGLLEQLCLYATGTILLALYCILFHNKPVLDKVFYLAGSGIMLVAESINLVQDITRDGFNGYKVIPLLYVLGFAMMVCMKLWPHPVFAIIGASFFLIDMIDQIRFMGLVIGGIPEPGGVYNFFSGYVLFILLDAAYALLLIMEMFYAKKAE